MTLRLMLCAFILLALGGCQNPKSDSGSVVPFRSDGLMALTMRPTGLGFGIDKDCHDYTVYKWNVGRIYETRGGLDSLRSFRSMTVTGPATRSDRVAPLKECDPRTIRQIRRTRPLFAGVVGRSLK